MDQKQIKVGDVVELVTQGGTEIPVGEQGTVTALNNESIKVEWHRTDIQHLASQYFWIFFPEWFRPVTYSTDNVNSPKHYNLNHKGIECIDAMEAMLSPEEFVGYIRGNIQKYTWRYPYKNGLEDLKKAQWYLNLLIKTLEEKGN